MSLLGTFLSGVRVLDLSRHVPGPLCTLYFADMGAEVLKIEPPAGDDIRQIGPRDKEGKPVFFETINAGKSCRRMDLRDPDVRGEFLQLAKAFDVLVESFRPGVLDRLGIGYEVLKAVNPRLIVCSLNGFGSGNANEKRAGHDNTFLALSGVLDRNGGLDEYPVSFEPPLADCAASLTASIAILGALHGRNRSGQGCHLEVALADAVMPLQMLQIAEMEATGEVPAKGTGLFTGGTAYYQCYLTSDGRHVSLGAVEPKFWAAFCNAADRCDWIARQHETRPQTALIAEVSSLFADMTLADAVSRFEPVDCCFAPVLRLDEALASEYVRSRGLAPRDESGRTQLLFPVRVDGANPAPRSALREINGIEVDPGARSSAHA